MIARPTFEVVSGASASERRLLSIATVRELTGIPSTGDGAVTDMALGQIIDAELARCARSCRLAAYRASPPTLAQESVRATWLPHHWRHGGAALKRPSELLLPWRAPITTITMTVGEVDLVENTDYRLLGAGVVERIKGRWEIDGTIVADYVAGFVPLADDPAYQEDGEPLPADLVKLIADQIRMVNDQSGIDLNLRSENIPDVWSGSFNVPGGTSIDESGLLMPLCDALSPYRAPSSIA